MSHPSFRTDFSRRTFLKNFSYAPLALLPAPFLAFGALAKAPHLFPFADLRITPHYPLRSPLDEMIALVPAGSDAFVTEKYAAEIREVLNRWASELKKDVTALDLLCEFSDAPIKSFSMAEIRERTVRKRFGIEVIQREFGTQVDVGRENFLDQMRNYLGSFSALRTVEFQITSITQIAPTTVAAEIRYTFIGDSRPHGLEQRIGTWKTEWVQQGKAWRALKWVAAGENVSRAGAPLFSEITAQAFGSIPSYKEQMLRGADYWRTVLDGASGIDVYGNQGIAVGDYDGDGYDDIYVCQGSGLPNRLYRNRGDGTFEDVTARAGVDVLDASSCALFADFENRGYQDLLVVASSGPLLFVNDGTGKFSLKKNAFNFSRPPQGTFTHAAIADYDHDGRLDVYFCLYNYYAGIDQYRYPSPYFDARNGPANFLLHNDGGWSFSNRTEAAGLNVDNDRYSFACAWGDHNGNGWPDLYVANDFGRSNLYRNNGDGTFASVAREAGVEDVGAGMSACWLDFDGNGKQDLYVANMWSAAGLRVSQQEHFHPDDPEQIRGLYRRHARGNSLYKNLGDGKFRNVAAETGAEFGGWAWSSDSWDFDHDGHSDIHIANGYISGTEQNDLSSFFWRQVVGNSPAKLLPSTNYEHGWNAINELIRSDRSWSGYERNVSYCNNGDGTFSDVSGLTGIDVADDSRAFALADFDHDGRLEILLKNRNVPQLRLLHNGMSEIRHSVAFRLRGTKSNRDAIGAAITLSVAHRAQTKYVQAGSGFLSQHTKEVFFGVGESSGFTKATVRWPSGTVQDYEHVPINHRVELIEGSAEVKSTPFAAAPLHAQPAETKLEALPEIVESWLLQPLRAPSFSLSDTAGKAWDLHSVSGKRLLLFVTSASAKSRSQLEKINRHQGFRSALQVLAVNLHDPQDEDDAAPRSFATKEKLTFPLLKATSEVTGVYNVLLLYLFDRHRDLGVPTSFLIDSDGMIAKVYQGLTAAETFVHDAGRIPSTSSERQNVALPFPGVLHMGAFQRNDFTYGVAFAQRGYLDAAGESFKQVIAERADDAEAHYNLGTLYLRQKNLSAARTELETAVRLKPGHAEAWNNLGMIAAEQGRTTDAVQSLKQCLALRPDYVVALLNLGNLYRRAQQFSEAQELLTRALEAEPRNAEANYSMGMLYAQQNEIEKARQSFERSIELRPGYSDALNNYGVLLVREQRYSDAEEKFRSCIQMNPKFDQAYLNLARLYVLLNEKNKAREVLESLLRQQPGHAMAHQALKMLE